jgi:hypothetical protein
VLLFVLPHLLRMISNRVCHSDRCPLRCGRLIYIDNVASKPLLVALAGTCDGLVVDPCSGLRAQGSWRTAENLDLLGTGSIVLYNVCPFLLFEEVSNSAQAVMA